ncbi:hypothetical protein ACFWSF_05275 [Streptomyces sp. NPDC058611]|uniref:hypothetical protein n=1 Tax=unclassified Streptomyces TaxID=2593676 RepID=UPI003669B6DA
MPRPSWRSCGASCPASTSTAPDDATAYVFGNRITVLDDDEEDGVTVTFADGARRTFDLVVVAEGLRSRTRSLVLPGTGTDVVRELGFCTAYLTVPRTADDTDLWRWHSAGRGRSVTLGPDDLGTIRATLAFLSDVRGLDEIGRAGIVTIPRRTFAGVGWAAPRVLAALDDAPLYFDAVGPACRPGAAGGRPSSSSRYAPSGEAGARHRIVPVRRRSGGCR